MSKSTWKPKRVGKSTQPEHQPGVVVVELAIKDPSVKQALEDIIKAEEHFDIQQTKETNVPHIFILEVDEEWEKTLTAIQTIRDRSQGTEIFLTSPSMDSTLLLEALRAGMREFIPCPIQPDEVKAAFERFKTRVRDANRTPEKRTGKILALFGGKGGTGTTSVAVNLAACLQAANPQSTVALVDANQHGGDIPLYLDLQTSHSFRDIAADLSRVDLAFLSSVLTKHESGIRVLSSGYDDLSAGRLSPECMELTIKLLQSMYDFVVVDCGHVLDLTAKKVLELSSNILVIVTMLVPVVHRTKRILEFFRGAHIPEEKVHLIVTRYLNQEKDVLKETEEILKHETAWMIPNDYANATAAINGGTPLVISAPRSGLTYSYQGLAAMFHDGSGARKGRSFWTSWLHSVKNKRPQPRALPA